MKKLIAGMMIAAVSMTAIGCSGKANDKEIIAKVGNVTIQMKELNKKMEYIEQMLEEQFGKEYKDNADIMAYVEEQRKAATEYLVEMEVVKQKANELGITVDDKSVQEEFDTYVKKFPSSAEFKAFLKENGLTEKDFKEQIREYKIMTALLDELTKDLVIDDQRIQEYYNEHIADYTKGAGADMYHILVATEEEAKKIKEEYEAGESFENLAKKYGTDGTKDVGGSLGFVEYESPYYDQDFLKGAKGLKEGEVSDPVKSSFGWHLIKVENIVNVDTITPLEEVKEDLREQIKAEEREKAFSEFIENAKKELHVEIYEDKLKVTMPVAKESTGESASGNVSESTSQSVDQ